MKWIKFSDMEPPIGMNIFVTTRGEVAILRWEKEYNEYDSQFISTYINTWACPREIYSLDFWAPVSFFEEHLPNAFEREDLKAEDDWYLKNKEHENIDKIKNETKDLSEKTDEQLNVFVKTKTGSCRYDYLKLREIDEFFKEINKNNETTTITPKESE